MTTQAEKAKSMTPEERAAWKKKMADAKAAKRAAAGKPVVIEKPAKKKPAKPAAAQPAAAPAKPANDDDDGYFL